VCVCVCVCEGGYVWVGERERLRKGGYVGLRVDMGVCGCVCLCARARVFVCGVCGVVYEIRTPVYVKCQYDLVLG